MRLKQDRTGDVRRSINVATASERARSLSSCSSKNKYVYPGTPLDRRLTIFKIDPKTQQPIPAHADTLWEVEVKTAEPIRNTPETPLSAAIEEVLEIQLLMKGLLDLRRQDV